jgi:hypothetical protein
MKIIVITAALIFVSTLLVSRVEANQSLANSVGKARFIVTVQVIDRPTKLYSSGEIATYSLHFKLLEVVKGAIPKTEEMTVRFNTSHLSNFSYLRKGSKCIVFIKADVSRTVVSVKSVPGYWIFCIQPYSPAKVTAIKRVCY